MCKKGIFFEKRVPEISHTPYSIPFLGVLHQNKALNNFQERGHHSIVKCNTGLEYALSKYLSKVCIKES